MITDPIKLGVAATAEQIRLKNRTILARAITLVESSHPVHQDFARALLKELNAHTGKSVRVGISGVPGVGKSTFVESFGLFLLSQGHRVAVLAIDPSSVVTGGSILGDKTRMAELSMDQRAFVRPSPTSGTLGGVAGKTREAMLLCEAAGFDVVLVETVGVGQSEHAVASMVDFFLILMLARAGDELQGIKRGILELADAVVINKADAEDPHVVKRALLDYESALKLVHPWRNKSESLAQSWSPRVLAASGLKGTSSQEIWEMILEHQKCLGPQFRENQQLEWFWTMVEQGVLLSLQRNPKVRSLRPQLEQALKNGLSSPLEAAEQVLECFFQLK